MDFDPRLGYVLIYLILEPLFLKKIDRLISKLRLFGYRRIIFVFNDMSRQ